LPKRRNGGAVYVLDTIIVIFINVYISTADNQICETPIMHLNLASRLHGLGGLGVAGHRLFLCNSGGPGQGIRPLQVMTGNEIRRSGASNIPEAFRLGDSLNVA
jgi:hypothetical protein